MLSDQVKILEEENKKLKIENNLLNMMIEKFKKQMKGFEDCCKMVIPNKVYTHKERRNTTVKFLDGSQMTVKRKAGEKDCIETAIAYCVLKQLLTTQDLKKLVEEREEH